MEAHAGKMDLQTVLCKYLHHLLLGGVHFKITNNDLPWYGEIFKK